MKKEFQGTKEKLPVERVFFADETSVYSNMSRTHGKSPVGTPVIEHRPYRQGQRWTLLGALGAEGLVGLMTVEGSTTKEVFLTWIEQVLGPELREGDVLVMDNLAVHKMPVVLEAFSKRGIRVVFTPPYHPEENPIELAWTWLKGWLRSAHERTFAGLNKALSMGCMLFSSEMALRMIHSCGYLIKATG